MPSSDFNIIPNVLSVITHIKPKKVLDVGVGFGKYGVLLREYLELWDGRYLYNDWTHQIDGIEVFEEYITPLHRFVYNNIFIGNALDVNIPDKYDMILMIDIIEHFTKEEGLKLLDKYRDIGEHILITTPVNVVVRDGLIFNNKYEEHKSQWGINDFQNLKTYKQEDLTLYVIL